MGLYGLIAYSVEQRTLEFGIRLALGADSPVLRNVLVRQAMSLATIGVGIGLSAAFGLTRLLTNCLYNVKANGPNHICLSRRSPGCNGVARRLYPRTPRSSH